MSPLNGVPASAALQGRHVKRNAPANRHYQLRRRMGATMVRHQPLPIPIQSEVSNNKNDKQRCHGERDNQPKVRLIRR